MEDGSTAVEADRLVAFINTLHLVDGDDVLADERAAAWLDGWLGAIAGVSPGERTDRDALSRLREVREGLRQLAAANNGEQPDDQIVGRASTVLGSVPLLVELGDRHQRAPRLTAQPGTDAAGRAIAALAGSYLTALASKDWSRVKVCAAPACRWAYLDSSRNRSRRWCDMADCGNRAKNRTWRERHPSRR